MLNSVYFVLFVYCPLKPLSGDVSEHTSHNGFNVKHVLYMLNVTY